MAVQDAFLSSDEERRDEQDDHAQGQRAPEPRTDGAGQAPKQQERDEAHDDVDAELDQRRRRASREPEGEVPLAVRERRER